MNILLLSMPDSFEHMPPIAVRMPNGALASLAGNIDPQHRVAIADLILVQSSVRATVERLVRERLHSVELLIARELGQAALEPHHVRAQRAVAEQRRDARPVHAGL